MAGRFRIALISLLWIGAACAQSSTSSSVVVFATIGEPPSGATLTKRADYVSFDATVTTSESDFAARAKLLGEGRTALTEAIAKQGVRFETGPSYLALDQLSSGSKFGSVSSLGRSNEAVVHVLLPLSKSGGNLFDTTSRFASNLSKLQLPARTSLAYSPFRLAVENPERYRSELIAKISEEVMAIKSAMKANGRINVSGLSSALRVRQLNDSEVQLSLPYEVSVELR
jgi:hypothetical protein